MATLNVYYQNVRGLRTKTNDIFHKISLSVYDVIVFTETWLVDDIFSNEMFDGRYLVWRRDRDYSRTSQKRGGGVLIAVRSELTVVERHDWRSSAEDIWVSLILKRSRPAVNYNLHICALYLCKENLGNSYYNQLHNFSINVNHLILTHPLDKFIIMGDFNFGKNVDWINSDSNELIPQNVSCNYLREFFDGVLTSNLSQYNGERNYNGRLLDLVFSNDSVNVTECHDPLALPVDLHHKPLIITADFVEIHKLTDKLAMKYVFSRGDYTAIKSELAQINWSEFLLAESLDGAVELFYNKLYELRDKYIPIKSARQSSYPPWYNSALIKVLREKYKYHRKFKTYGNVSDFHSFSLLRNRAVKLEKICFNSYMDKIESSIIENPKSFWAYVKSKRNSGTFPKVMCYGDRKASTGEEISNLFAAYFHSTFQEPDPVPATSDGISVEDSVTSIGSIGVSHSQVLNLLKALDLSKSGGPDLIPPVFIVNCAESLVIPLCILFRRSLSEGIVPKIWKSAFVTPVFKKGNKSDISNYRPISKICLFSKILERIVFTDVYAAMKCNFGDEQHGFLRKRSTTSNLILSHEFISEGMEQRAQVDVIYTDYSKCFDRIDHRLLLEKLLKAGIHGDLYRWFSSYIDNRTQAVVLQGYTSGWSSVPSGVPQGSILGSLLFTLFIADVKHCFETCYILLYADDMKIHKIIRNISDTYLLQNDLNRFEEYCRRNRLELNVTKCFHMTFTRQKSFIDSTYKLYNIGIGKVNSIRDLGITQDSKLLFDQHIDIIVNKASRALGFIMRTSACFRSLKPIKVLYCSFVRSHLEYASQVWNPQYEIYKSRIEGIQRKFLKYLDWRAKQVSVDYMHRCRRYHFLPLDRRRYINDVCYLFNIANGSVDCPELVSKLTMRTNQMGLRQRPLLHVPYANTNYRRNSYFPRAGRSFNDISCEPGIDLFCTNASTVRKLLAKAFFVQEAPAMHALEPYIVQIVK